VSKTDSKEKAKATRAAHQEAQRQLWAEQRAAINAARGALTRLMEREDATPEQILRAAELLVEIGM